MPFLPQFPPDQLYAALAAACSGIAIAGALALAGRRARALQAAHGEIAAGLASVAAALSALRSESGAQGATLLTLASRLDGLQRDLASDARHAAPATTAAGSSAFELAIRLARAGGSVEELMAACLVSRHEAELALRLHGPQSRAGSGRLAAVR